MRKMARFFVRRPVIKIKDWSQWELLDYLVNDGWALKTNTGKIPAIPISEGVVVTEHKRIVFNWKQLDVGRPYLMCLARPGHLLSLGDMISVVW